MNEEQWRAAWRLFQSGGDVPRDEIDNFLNGSDASPEVRLVVARMLLVSDTPDPSCEPIAGAPVEPLPARTEIDRYQLVEKLGEGGMGVVYRAIEREPVRREVAVKIIKPGMDSRLVAARFGAERQALSLMDHPNIARVVDAGTTNSKRAYFVMDLIPGQPITRYCDRARLTLRQRVELMIPVCQAIQHAHQKGIIHRDIKPSNILVVKGPEGAIPKVIDFGIAKATETPLHDGATLTRASDVVGTFAYMSPEQAEPGGRGVDVRSDVYSLGAVLYELLTGAPPLAGLSLRDAGLATILRRIQEQTPLPPSRRVRDLRHSIEAIAAKRGSSAPQLRAQLDGECDWIAMKALEKDRERRYESAAAMARDLENYLAGNALEASPPSRTYRIRNFAAHHRWSCRGRHYGRGDCVRNLDVGSAAPTAPSQ